MKTGIRACICFFVILPLPSLGETSPGSATASCCSSRSRCQSYAAAVAMVAEWHSRSRSGSGSENRLTYKSEAYADPPGPAKNLGRSTQTGGETKHNELEKQNSCLSFCRRRSRGGATLVRVVSPAPLLNALPTFRWLPEIIMLACIRVFVIYQRGIYRRRVCCWGVRADKLAWVNTQRVIHGTIFYYFVIFCLNARPCRFGTRRRAVSNGFNTRNIPTRRVRCVVVAFSTNRPTTCRQFFRSSWS